MISAGVRGVHENAEGWAERYTPFAGNWAVLLQLAHEETEPGSEEDIC